MMGMEPRNHPRQVKARGADDAVDDRATHPLQFAAFDEEWGPFTVDVAASPANAKCDRFYTREDDGLEQDWSGETVWCNPPFSDIAPWLRKAWASVETAERIVMLLPANRTEQPWWQAMVEPFRDRASSSLRVEFLPGRMAFLRPGQTAVHAGERPIFGVCLLVFQRANAWTPLRYDAGAVTGGLFG